MGRNPGGIRVLRALWLLLEAPRSRAELQELLGCSEPVVRQSVLPALDAAEWFYREEDGFIFLLEPTRNRARSLLLRPVTAYEGEAADWPRVYRRAQAGNYTYLTDEYDTVWMSAHQGQSRIVGKTFRVWDRGRRVPPNRYQLGECLDTRSFGAAAQSIYDLPGTGKVAVFSVAGMERYVAIVRWPEHNKSPGGG